MSNDSQTSPAADAQRQERDTKQPMNPKRKFLLIGLTVFFLIAGIAYGAYWALHGRYFEETDDAYVQGNLIQITPQVAGTVLSIAAQDTDLVKAGQTLVTLDPSDAKVAMDQAKAQLAQTVREVRTLYANNGSLQANVALRQADAARSAAEVARLQDDVLRRQSLTATGAVSKEEMQHALAALTSAKSALAATKAAVTAAQEQLMSNRSLTEGTSVEEHPNVQRAAARLREVYLAVRRADLPSPVTGYVARRSVQVGQRIAPGTPLMAVIPLDEVWVDANFKEVQLREMRIGQPVSLTADVYGKKVEYHGKIAGFGAGTGAAFALLPAQNATGNWIKVVQRVPVRISLDANELHAHPLRIGLSMIAEVDLHDQDGKILSDSVNTAPVSTTAVFQQDDQGADQLIDQIITANLGHPVKTHAPATRSKSDRAVSTSGAKKTVTAS